MTIENGTCWRCRYFDRDADETDSEAGYCRRYPPTVVLVDGDDAVAAYPGVDIMDWCGEFDEQR